MFEKPTFILQDLDLIKKITVKNFDIFADRDTVVDFSRDPILVASIFFQRANEWKKTRITLIPSFAVNKIKTTMNLVSTCTTEFIDELAKQHETTVDIDVKDTFSRLIIDIIASFAFGVTINSMKDKCNPFYLLVKKTELSVVKLLFMSMFPFLAKVRVCNFFLLLKRV